MSRFDRYLLSQLMVLFGFFALVLVAIYWVNRAVGLFDQLIGDGQSALVFLEFTLLTLPNVIRMVLPIAAFAAAIYVTNRLMQDSELVVMQATGFSPWRLARPVLVFGVIVSLGLAVLMHVLVPTSRSVLSDRRAEIADNVTARLLDEGVFNHPAAGVTLYIRDIAPTGELLDLFLSDSRAAGDQRIYTARRAFLVRGETGPKLVMVDGMVQALGAGGQRLSVTRFADFTYDVGGLITGSTTSRRDLEELSTTDLLRADPALVEETGETRAAFLYEAHARLAKPFLAAAAAMIGFSTLLLGAFSRFGLWRQVLAAMGLLVVLQLVDNAAGGA
ncbi:MAG: LPS export ABC transporter permease LptF, partial [Rhodobacterales bacterium]|nr:LPS export ABC transporter permease LptF [Rhodobacterales bacterium]